MGDYSAYVCFVVTLGVSSDFRGLVVAFAVHAVLFFLIVTHRQLPAAGSDFSFILL